MEIDNVTKIKIGLKLKRLYNQKRRVQIIRGLNKIDKEVEYISINNIDDFGIAQLTTFNFGGTKTENIEDISEYLFKTIRCAN